MWRQTAFVSGMCIAIVFRDPFPPRALCLLAVGNWVWLHLTKKRKRA